MNQLWKAPHVYLGFAIVMGVLTLSYVVLLFFNDDDRSDTTQPLVASEQVIASFYTGLAALDVDENERAAAVLNEAVQLESREPAMWANLAVAQIRLNERDKAQASLQHAIELAGDSRELAMLNAQMLEYSGHIESAIEQLRSLHQVWPENVRATFTLASLLAQIRDDAANAERLALLSDVLNRAPGNLRTLTEQARLAATMGRDDELRAAITSLEQIGTAWPRPIQEQLDQAREAMLDNDYRQTALSLTFLQNLLKPQPEYQRSQLQLGIQPIGEVGTPLRSPLRLRTPANDVAEADFQLSFEQTTPFGKAARPDFVMAMEHPGGRRSTLMSLTENVLHLDESAALPFPGLSTNHKSAGMCVADLNFDFQPDLVLVGERGCEILLGGESGELAKVDIELNEFDAGWKSVWSVDIEADGDLDLLLSDHESGLRCFRNNGDMTFTYIETSPAISGVVSLVPVDYDQDSDVDLVALAKSGMRLACRNERGGLFAVQPILDGEPCLAIATGDVNGDGQMDLVSMDQSGEIHVAQWTPDGWSESLATRSPSADVWAAATAGEVLLAVADLDNNGGVDLVASGEFGAEAWLRTADASWAFLSKMPEMRVTSIVDYDHDGLLDLIGMSESGTTVALNQSQANFGWHIVQPLANTATGDKRINSFGIGGRIEVRAGSLIQASAIDSPQVHFGLGNHRSVDVARITWPNGTVQAEFGLQSGESIVANQRLKGSCPWVFAFDGQEFRFVKDFIWRSPLGLRINAQTTAGVTQTEDWIKIPGGLLKAVEGRYQLRITAELWEAHFFDHIGLIAVDHPTHVGVFVDERFVPQSEPAQEIVVASVPEPLQNILDDRGTRLDDVLGSNDGNYADGFALGAYQGVAENHWVEFEVPDNLPSDRPITIVGHGWIYPTDSSLNVALDQGGANRPFGLTLEQMHPDGNWFMVRDDLGFPAGKNKDVLLPLSSESLKVSRRFRLRTNMEIYWDSLRWSHVVASVEPLITPIETSKADLRFRGYSELLPVNRRRPDTPVYKVAGTQQRWLDLEGYYTRFGDVSELLDAVDDRYAILNAGDELILEFTAIDEPPAGWQRDFILVGDGWVKDGDFNTAFSRTVQPLPIHASSEYLGPVVPLQQEPVFRQHADDWQRYHTRYIVPNQFHQKLWRPNMLSQSCETRP